jgi:hypothetical protein
LIYILLIRHPLLLFPWFVVNPKELALSKGTPSGNKNLQALDMAENSEAGSISFRTMIASFNK